eukprot:TRINITY_DN1720_c0_g1_i1.p1 TRINITY_DN1720_c0_g1~~TRINITY_DN1720_c0_g1_i1.p1  ORF type:complete len:536 (-),score=94.92 TRINITY_DN1720_c0_g1_i1:99-1472(-)
MYLSREATPTKDQHDWDGRKITIEGDDLVAGDQYILGALPDEDYMTVYVWFEYETEQTWTLWNQAQNLGDMAFHGVVPLTAASLYFGSTSILRNLEYQVQEEFGGWEYLQEPYVSEYSVNTSGLQPPGLIGHSMTAYRDIQVQIFGGLESYDLDVASPGLWVGDLTMATGDDSISSTSHGTVTWKYFNESSPPPRSFHASIVYLNDLFIFGGFDEDGNVLNDMWKIKVGGKDEETWEKIDEEPDEPIYHPVLVSRWFRLYIIGSGADGKMVVYRYSPGIGGFKKLDAKNPPDNIRGFAIATCGTKAILIGGETNFDVGAPTPSIMDPNDPPNSPVLSSRVFTFHIPSDTWEEYEFVGPEVQPDPRKGASAAPFGNKLYVVGGQLANGDKPLETWIFQFDQSCSSPPVFIVLASILEIGVIVGVITCWCCHAHQKKKTGTSVFEKLYRNNTSVSSKLV